MKPTAALRVHNWKKEKKKKEPVRPVCLLHPVLGQTGTTPDSVSRRGGNQPQHPTVPPAAGAVKSTKLGAAGGRGVFMAQVGLGKKKTI